MKNILRKMKKSNKGTTLVEMIVSFALLAIFLVCAGTIISLITGMYYHIKGETYAKQVSDIVLEKVASEVEGAKYEEPVTEGEESAINPVIAPDFSSMTLYDRTFTKVTMVKTDGLLEVRYSKFENDETPEASRNGTIWRFDKNVYNGYSIDSLKFVSGSKISSFDDAADYGFKETDLKYNDNIVVVFLKLTNPKYYDYYSYRVIKMHNVPASTAPDTTP